ncbi:MAG: hypothetical protein GY868_12100 [Deltaproteobacteria bacterium]|nr:hypothetical protein [Deltaproteobacteria bacterium]
MKQIPEPLKKKLIGVVRKDYDECRFFLAAAQLLTNKIQDVCTAIDKEQIDFNSVRDTIGEIGIFISNTEKSLEEVEDCYSKLVDILAEAQTKH